MRSAQIITLLLLVTFTWAQPLKRLEYKTQSEDKAITLNPFWKSTGFSPADLIFNKDFELYLRLLGSMRNNTLEYIRPHYLLDLVEVKGTKENPEYNWSRLDYALDVLVESNFKLIFELMGNPSQQFNDFHDHETVFRWKDFIKDLAVHLKARYGEKEIYSWYFESTNEPDRRHYWPHGYVSFLHYYDACSEGLLEADPKIKFGGPGPADGVSVLMSLFLEHINHGQNFITGKKGSRCDYISLHKKALAKDMIKQEMKLFKLYDKINPEFAKLPIMNNEADPLAGWGKKMWWRPTPWYGAFVAQCIDKHMTDFSLPKSANYIIMSNDNTFLGGFYKRTLMARFIPGDNYAFLKGAAMKGGSKSSKNYNDERKAAQNYYLVKKPVLAAMNLYTYLGEKYIPLSTPTDTVAGTIVTKHNNGDIALIAYNTPHITMKKSCFGGDTCEINKRDLEKLKTVNMHIDISELEVKGNYKMITQSIDMENGNAFTKWVEQGKPEDPSAAQTKAMIDMENAMVTGKVKWKKSGIDVKAIPSSVTLVYLAKDNKSTPVAPTDLNTMKYKGLEDDQVTVVNWKNSNSSFYEFEVFGSKSKNGEFEKVNVNTITDNYFTLVGTNASFKFIKVRTKNAFDKLSPFSEVISLDKAEIGKL